MSRETQGMAGAALHERARMLAAESVDMPLEPGDETWLSDHLEMCPDCAGAAAEYRANHLELRSLTTPEPPRDLWARTSAGLDLAEAASSKRSPQAGRAAGPGRRPLFSTVAAVATVVAVAVGSLLIQSPILKPAPGSAPGSTIALGTGSPAGPSSAPKGPLAVFNGTSYWISSAGGVYEIKGGTTQCSATDGSCTVPAGSGQTLGSIESDSSVSAVIAPDAQSAAVWTDDKVAIVPLAAEAQTVPLDQLTPRPTAAVTATPAATATHAATASPSPAQTPILPATTPDASSGAVATTAPSATPTPTPTPTPVPTATPTAIPATTRPTAILSGYEIVGRDPEFSVDGTQVAFSARPTDHSTGPDVFVWHSGDEQARRVTASHADLFAGWYGGQVIISEISVGPASGQTAGAGGGADASSSTSYVFDPITGTSLKIGRPMLLPVVDPTSRYLVYWSGSVEFDPVSGLWQPGNGDLYFDTWADLTLTPAPLTPAASSTPSATPAPTATPSPTSTSTPAATATVASSAVVSSAVPSATVEPTPTLAARTATPAGPALPQLLPVAAKPGSVHGWVVRWDASGQHVAIWVADPNSSKVGRLSLFSIDRTTGLVDTNEPLLAADKVMPTISFDQAHLVYTSAVDGKTYRQVVPAVPPSTVSTPAPTTPGQQPTAPSSSSSAAPQATDRPGN